MSDVMQRFFSAFGIGARSFPAKLVGSLAGRPGLVVATAACVWDDLDNIGVHGDQNAGWTVFCVNDIAMHYPGRVDHLYSNQHRWIPHWVGARRETIAGLKVREKWGEIGMTHSCRVGGQYQWPWPGHGTSTLGAVYTALAMGCVPVVICGAPLDNSPHYFDAPWIETNFGREIGLKQGTEDLMYWSDAKKRLFGGKVFSQSGRTRELLGAYR